MNDATEKEKPGMVLTSSAFAYGGWIPQLFSCDGEDVSPPLSWRNMPVGVKSFALFCEDPDAPGGPFLHWAIFDIPGNLGKLEQGVPPEPIMANGARQGLNDGRKVGYSGPCPPVGSPHRYYFHLLALDAMLEPEGLPEGRDLRDKVAGHVIAEAVLMGRYAR